MSDALPRFVENLSKLTAKFEADKAHYLSKDYLEAQARMDFITPFFKALGWNVENEAGLLHHEREVLVEKGDMETTGRPDYSFRMAGQTKFIVEAKAPSETLSAHLCITRFGSVRFCAPTEVERSGSMNNLLAAYKSPGFLSGSIRPRPPSPALLRRAPSPLGRGWAATGACMTRRVPGEGS